ncbi:MAG: acyl carrier protein [Gammaproteobacteria bacterium]|nr:acyl carrier protein [Gammaproteobacteria bacterium]
MDRREQALADIWTRILKEASLDPDSRFFQVGGSSLDAMEMQSQVEQVFGVPVSLDCIFDDPTLAEFAAQLPPPAIATAASDEAPAATHQDAAPSSRNPWWRLRWRDA